MQDNVLGIQPEENGQEALPSSLINSDDVEILITNSLFENNENAAIPPTMVSFRDFAILLNEELYEKNTKALTLVLL